MSYSRPQKLGELIQEKLDQLAPKYPEISQELGKIANGLRIDVLQKALKGPERPDFRARQQLCCEVENFLEAALEELGLDEEKREALRRDILKMRLAIRPLLSPELGGSVDLTALDEPFRVSAAGEPDTPVTPSPPIPEGPKVIVSPALPDSAPPPERPAPKRVRLSPEQREAAERFKEALEDVDEEAILEAGRTLFSMTGGKEVEVRKYVSENLGPVYGRRFSEAINAQNYPKALEACQHYREIATSARVTRDLLLAMAELKYFHFDDEEEARQLIDEAVNVMEGNAEDPQIAEVREKLFGPPPELKRRRRRIRALITLGVAMTVGASAVVTDRLTDGELQRTGRDVKNFLAEKYKEYQSDQLIREARQARQAGRPEAAMALYRKARELNPDEIDAFYSYIMLAAKEENADLTSLVKEVNAELEKKPREARFHFLLGHLLRRQGNDKEASTAFAKAHEINPDNAGYLKIHIRGLLDSGEGEKALGLAEKAVKEQPDNLDYAILKADTLIMLGRQPEEAVQLADRVIQAGRQEGQGDYFKERLGRAYELKSAALFNQGVALFNQGRKQEPDEAGKKFSASLEALKTARNILGNETSVIANMAYTYQALGLTAKGANRDNFYRSALKYFRKALEQSPGNTEYLSAQADIHEAMGNHKMAKKLRKKVKALKEGKPADDRIKNLRAGSIPPTKSSGESKNPRLKGRRGKSRR